MKILILSDTHGDTSAAERIIRQEMPDLVIHLGDCIRDAEDMEQIFPYLPICKVPGNNDFFTDCAKEKVIRVGDELLFLCHGHTTGVKNGPDLQLAKALRHSCRFSLFGHTHRTYLEEKEGVILLNPGSLTYGDTYALIHLNPGEKPECEIRYDR